MKNFLLLGSDTRQKYLKEILEKKGYYAKWVDLPQNDDMEKSDVVLLPVADSRKYYDMVKEKLHAGHTVFGCNLPEMEKAHEKIDNGAPLIIEYMNQDEIAYKNAVATAEGAIAEAIINSRSNLSGSKSLLLGYGRCGKILADRLLRMYSSVTVADRKEASRAMAQALGFASTAFPLEEHLQKHGIEYDYIFNTVPQKTLTANELSMLSSEVTIIDIASKPGGVDYNYCKENSMTAVSALGLPGKYSPKGSAEILMEVIEKNLL